MVNMSIVSRIEFSSTLKFLLPQLATILILNVTAQIFYLIPLKIIE